MKQVKQLLQSEAFLYLVFGVLTTVVSIATRTLCFALYPNALLATLIGNVAGILFAFVTNDRWVFRQVPQGWFKRLISFTTARLTTLALDLALTFIFVDTLPGIIGQFVNNDPSRINFIENLIAQVLIIVLNYVLSKLFVFTDKKETS